MRGKRCFPFAARGARSMAFMSCRFDSFLLLSAQVLRVNRTQERHVSMNTGKDKLFLCLLNSGKDTQRLLQLLQMTISKSVIENAK